MSASFKTALLLRAVLMHVTTPDIEAAAAFLADGARVLERRVFERLLRGGGPQPVRDAVAAYRNPDGGFGHALEPDGRCPGSQPLAIEYGLRLLHDSEAWDEELAAGACQWLAAHAPASGGVTFVEPSIDGWPHAPWWAPEEGAPASLITTGLIAGTLHAHGVAHPWLGKGSDLLWGRIDALTATTPYDMRGVLHFLDHVPDGQRAAATIARLEPLVMSVVELDPEASGEVLTPLDFSPRPGARSRALFGDDLIDTHLDHLASAQRKDGGWMFNWLAWSPAAEREWRGAVTVEALRVLLAHGRC